MLLQLRTLSEGGRVDIDRHVDGGGRRFDFVGKWHVLLDLKEEKCRHRQVETISRATGRKHDVPLFIELDDCSSDGINEVTCNQFATRYVQRGCAVSTFSAGGECSGGKGENRHTLREKNVNKFGKCLGEEKKGRKGKSWLIGLNKSPTANRPLPVYHRVTDENMRPSPGHAAVSPDPSCQSHLPCLVSTQ